MLCRKISYLRPILTTCVYLRECDALVYTLPLAYMYTTSRYESSIFGDESGRCEESRDRTHGRLVSQALHATVFYMEPIFLNDDHDGHSKDHRICTLKQEITSRLYEFWTHAPPSATGDYQGTLKE